MTERFSRTGVDAVRRPFDGTFRRVSVGRGPTLAVDARCFDRELPHGGLRNSQASSHPARARLASGARSFATAGVGVPIVLDAAGGPAEPMVTLRTRGD